MRTEREEFPEDENGCIWEDRTYDNDNNMVYWTNNIGEWSKCTYDGNNKELTYRDDDGKWIEYNYEVGYNLIFIREKGWKRIKLCK